MNKTKEFRKLSFQELYCYMGYETMNKMYFLRYNERFKENYKKEYDPNTCYISNWNNKFKSVYEVTKNIKEIETKIKEL